VKWSKEPHLLLEKKEDTVDSGYTGYGYTGNLLITDNPVISPLIYMARPESLNIMESDIFLRFFCGRPV
jgi:hypothetical protein